MGRWIWPLPSYALDRVALASRSFELAAQVVDGLTFVRHELFYPLSHAIFDAADLPADLLDIGLLVPISLALAPEPRVLLAQVSHRHADLAVEASAVAGLRARHLLCAIPAENQDSAHGTRPFPAVLRGPRALGARGWSNAPDGEVELAAAFRSTTVAALRSRRRSGEISNTESGRPAAAHTRASPSRSR